MLKENFVKLYEDSFIKNWEKSAARDYTSKKELTYGEYAKKIARLHSLFTILNIKEGDTIAVSGKNSTAWSLIYMSSVLYGAVIVPILDEFHHKDITHIINHSEAKLFFCDNDIWSKLHSNDFDKLQGAVSLQDEEVLFEKSRGSIKSGLKRAEQHFHKLYPKGYTSKNVKYKKISGDKLAVICYTSGTTSMTKGVMLTHNNLCGNVVFAIENYSKYNVKLQSTLCVLPLAHTYGAAFSLLVMLQWGAKITFLGKIPSPNTVMEACAESKPTLLFFVPLVFEKIYKSRIEPMLKKPLIAALVKTPIIGSFIYRMIGKKLYKLFGGELSEVVIGGAAINKDVEAFFYKAKFPFLIGYGMTECAPLISYEYHTKFVPTSVGKALPGLMDVRIVKENESDETGEIQTSGENVMLGYYKEPELTAATFSEDGWLRTGDLGKIDEDGNIFIMGRSKTMLLGSSGENIYPEPIESKLANMPFISEALVIQNQNKLEAWVYPDSEAVAHAELTEEEVERVMNDNLKTLNTTLARFEMVSSIKIMSEPFPKTPKRTIKRYSAEQMIREIISKNI